MATMCPFCLVARPRCSASQRFPHTTITQAGPRDPGWLDRSVHRETSEGLVWGEGCPERCHCLILGEAPGEWERHYALRAMSSALEPPRRTSALVRGMAEAWQDIVDTYTAWDGRGAKDELEHFRRQPTLEAAISEASLARFDHKKLSHQRRIPVQVLERADERW